MALKKATIVLEGGATRGIFTSGALDYLMEQDIYFSDVIGVSAGACNAVDYVSRQPGRTRDCMIPNTKDMKYINGVKDTIREKSLMNMDLIFDKYPNELIPFDFDAYFQSEMHCELVTTNCLTGNAEYMTETEDPDRLMKICRASSSMPLAAPIGSNRGVCTKDFIQILIDEIDLPIIVDAGIGKPSQACEVMEMGAAAVMANTAIATAGDIPAMAAAFREAIEAGRKAYLSGCGRVKMGGASASSPLTGFLSE